MFLGALSLTVWGSEKVNDKGICYELLAESQVLCFSPQESAQSRVMVRITIHDRYDANIVDNLGSYALMSTGRCIDCNKNFFAKIYRDEIAGERFDSISPIQFDGKVDFKARSESRFLKISDRTYMYKKAPRQQLPLQHIVSN